MLVICLGNNHSLVSMFCSCVPIKDNVTHACIFFSRLGWNITDLRYCGWGEGKFTDYLLLWDLAMGGLICSSLYVEEVFLDSTPTVKFAKLVQSQETYVLEWRHIQNKIVIKSKHTSWLMNNKFKSLKNQLLFLKTCYYEVSLICFLQSYYVFDCPNSPYRYLFWFHI